MTYKLVSALHVVLSLISVILFCMSIYNVKHAEKHERFAKLFIYIGILATLLSFILVAIPLYLKNLFPYFQPNAVIPARYLRFLDLNYLKFSYLSAFTRGLLFIFLANRILFLRQYFQNFKIYLALQVPIGLLILSILIFLSFNYNFVYLQGLASLFLSYAIVEILIRTQKKNNVLRHSTLGVFTFLVFLQTGLVGGISNFIPALAVAQGTTFYMLRFFPLIITLIYYAARTLR